MKALECHGAASTLPPEQQAIIKHSDAEAEAKAATALLPARAEQLEAKEAQLVALSESLGAAEGALLATQAQHALQPAGWGSAGSAGAAGTASIAPAPAPVPAEAALLAAALASPSAAARDEAVGAGEGSVLAERWRCLSARRAELAARWQCLLEEKRQLSLMLEQQRRHKGGGSGSGGTSGGEGFEPGQTPLRDVTCAVVTHQLDVPFFSCCFQR